MVSKLLWIIGFCIVFSITAVADASEENTGAEESLFSKLPIEAHGFYEVRGGYRLQNDKYEKDMSIMEGRLQFDLFSYFDWGDVKVKGDLLGDLVTEEGDFDLREANIFTRPTDFMDVKVGRQILTWGTGDLVFINDLFPKDWQSFFIGRNPLINNSEMRYLLGYTQEIARDFTMGVQYYIEQMLDYGPYKRNLPSGPALLTWTGT